MMSHFNSNAAYPLTPDAFVSGTRFAIESHRRVGEWGQTIPGRFTSPDDTFPLGWLRRDVHNLLKAFPWVTPESADIFVLPDQPDTWAPSRGPIEDWLAGLGPDTALTGGMTIISALTIMWQTPHNVLEPITVAGGAEYVASWLNSEALQPQITIWPNVFTDRLGWVDTEAVAKRRDSEQPEGAAYFVIPFAEAAQYNRHLLRSALNQWEALSGGTIDYWDTDMLNKASIERYGIRDDAVLDDYWLDD